jgi:phosphatidate cytidylyltransferase
MSSSIAKRIASAVFALLLLFGTHHFFAEQGLIVLCLLVIAGGVFEYLQIGLSRFQLSMTHKYWFLANAIFLVGVGYFSQEIALNHFAILLVVFLTGTLWIFHGSADNQKLLDVMCFSTLGLFYSVLLPLFAVKLLTLKLGVQWFAFLCVVVFSGDVFAYFGGRFFGRRKLFESISPNKTVEGAISGLLGSLLMTFLFHKFFFEFFSLSHLLVISLQISLLAQSGDLFESLLKRVSQVKDSGTIMPGHGGVLDRVDGIYFAAPLVYFTAVNINV